MTNFLILNLQLLEFKPIINNPTPFLNELLIVALDQFATIAEELQMLARTDLVGLGGEPCF